MNKLSQHELLDLQEHIRGEAATAASCQQFAQMAADPDIRSFCEDTARAAQQNCQRLMSMLQKGQAH